MKVMVVGALRLCGAVCSYALRLAASGCGSRAVRGCNQRGPAANLCEQAYDPAATSGDNGATPWAPPSHSQPAARASLFQEITGWRQRRGRQNAFVIVVNRERQQQDFR